MQLECFDVHFYVPVAVVTCTCFLAIIGLFVFYTRGLTENCYPAYKTANEVNEAQVARKRRQLSRRRTNKNFHVLVGYSLDTSSDFQHEISSSNEFSISRRRSYCCQELDLESQKDQPYVQAILQYHDWNTIAVALVYLHKHNALVRDAKTVLRAIQHMQDLAEVPGRGFTEHMGFNIPNDYIETELRDTVFDLHDDLTSDEFIWVNKEFLRKHCYPPTPCEFSRIYEKCIETAKLRKRFDKLWRKYKNLQECLNEKEQILEERRERISELENLVPRAFCKICMIAEVSVVYQPCEHAVVCRSCHERVMASKTRRARTCHICNCQIKNTKNFILA
ncbi:uncharacterized protein LOC128167064 [Crassostrea angulata]|uniref:uncharacterized protein LOC128167064 n=1 Tax=Magallana angulata TaxID=2784310 RepID=UPI0022B16B7D|nr:uncharacterized protein LOC128167064 [Crassostrea angulata]